MKSDTIIEAIEEYFTESDGTPKEKFEELKNVREKLSILIDSIEKDLKD